MNFVVSVPYIHSGLTKVVAKSVPEIHPTLERAYTI